jgi:hypothetical protein
MNIKTEIMNIRVKPVKLTSDYLIMGAGLGYQNRRVRQRDVDGTATR